MTANDNERRVLYHTTQQVEQSDLDVALNTPLPTSTLEQAELPSNDDDDDDEFDQHDLVLAAEFDEAHIDALADLLHDYIQQSDYINVSGRSISLL